jgi:hypothetical protein
LRTYKKYLVGVDIGALVRKAKQLIT